MNHKLVVAIVIRNAQFIRELTAIGLHDVSNTCAERTFDTCQLLKHFVAGGMTGIAKPLFVHFVGILRQYSTRCARGINQLVSHGIAAITIRCDLANNNSINTQSGPRGRLHLLSGARLLR
ncbi:hypothetical protein D3C75_1042710 [compost metagenome]